MTLLLDYMDMYLLIHHNYLKLRTHISLYNRRCNYDVMKLLSHFIVYVIYMVNEAV